MAEALSTTYPPLTRLRQGSHLRLAFGGQVGGLRKERNSGANEQDSLSP